MLERDFAGLPVYPAGQNEAKLSAGWMIEQCGWKGRSMGRAAVSGQHALVLVNKDKATGNEILTLANAIQESVQNRFGVKLQPEPLIIQ
jgi:UDP-N-acetylmuramate dehydrogenase